MRLRVRSSVGRRGDDDHTHTSNEPEREAHPSIDGHRHRHHQFPLDVLDGMGRRIRRKRFIVVRDDELSLFFASSTDRLIHGAAS